MKNSFVMYTDWNEQLNILTLEQRGSLLTAIMCYQTGEELPEMDATTNMAFSFIKAQMDRDTEKYKEIVKKRSEAGKSGGRPTKTDDSNSEEEKANALSQKQTKAKKANGFSEKQTKAKKADNDNVNDTDTVTVTDDEKKKESKKESPKKRERFTPPTLSEVEAYCKERNKGVDAQKFIDFYTSKGWKVGNQPMKDWKAAVRTWERRDERPARAAPVSTGSRFQERHYGQTSEKRGYDEMFVQGMYENF